MWIPSFIKTPIFKMVIGAVDSELTQYATVEKLSSLILTTVNEAIENASVSSKVSDKTVEKVCKGCSLGGRALTHLSDALNPKGENGKAISNKEGALIMNDVSEACGVIITQDWLDEKRTQLIGLIKSKLGVD